MKLHWHKLGPFTIFDVETSGGNAVRDRIVELSAVRVNVDGKLSRFSTLVNPGKPISYHCSAVHQITNDMVKDAPDFAAIGGNFIDFCQGSTLVAHNARFDLAFLQESLYRSGLPLWEGQTIDTIRLLKKSHPGLPSYRLQRLRVIFQLDDCLENMQAHRAGSDAEWTMQLLGISLQRLLDRQNSNSALSSPENTQ